MIVDSSGYLLTEQRNKLSTVLWVFRRWQVAVKLLRAIHLHYISANCLHQVPQVSVLCATRRGPRCISTSRGLNWGPCWLNSVIWETNGLTWVPSVHPQYWEWLHVPETFERFHCFTVFHCFTLIYLHTCQTFISERETSQRSPNLGFSNHELFKYSKIF